MRNTYPDSSRLQYDSMHMRLLAGWVLCSALLGCGGSQTPQIDTFLPGANLCTNGATRCSGTQIQGCTSNTWSLVQDCSVSGNVCSSAGSAVSCQPTADPNACPTPGGTRCLGSVLQTCTAGDWTSTQDCSATANQKCLMLLDVLDSFQCAVPQFPTCTSNGPVPVIPQLVPAFEDFAAPTNNWVQLHVSANEAIASVQLSINGGTWQNMNNLSFGWGIAATVPANGTAQFKAISSTGDVAVSDVYNWPAATIATAPTVNTVITTAAGPGSYATPRAIDKRIYGVSIADWSAADYMPSIDPAYLAFLKALSPGLVRWPSNTNGYIFSRTSTGSGYLTPAMIDSFIALCRAAGTQPNIGVNISTGNAAAAADMVRYANIEKHYGVLWWHLGDGSDVLNSVSTYNQEYSQVAEAMRAVDSSIRLVGGQVPGPNALAFGSVVDMLTPIVTANGAMMNAVSIQYTALDSGDTSANSSATATAGHLLQEDAWDWRPAGLDFADLVTARVSSVAQQYAPGAEMWVDSLAEDLGPASDSGLGNTLAGALWTADSLGRFMDGGVSGAFHYVFKGIAGQYYGLLDENDVPRPEYYAYWMYSQLFGDRLVAARSDQQADVNVHAALHSADGTLRVLIINKTAVSRNVRVYLSDFTPRGSLTYTLQSTGGVQGQTAAINNLALASTTIGNGAQAIPGVANAACGDNEVTVAPYTATMMIFIP